MDFTLVLFLLVVVTGICWVLDKCIFAPRRRQRAQQVAAQFEQQNFASIDQQLLEKKEELVKSTLAGPAWLEFTAGIFGLILVIFMIRSFVVEPFKIPSGSMEPTLLPGDYILVNKFTYGVRLPLINQKITAGNPLQRGDVVVFRYPFDPKIDYIKRVVGLPGDVVAYENKKLTINGVAVTKNPLPDYFNQHNFINFQQFNEKLGAHQHAILTDSDIPAAVQPFANFPFKSNCTYNNQGVTCTVPAGHYFMMGDNRDNSEDSRYWGFVPDQNIVGKAFFIWFNFSNLKRIGSIQ